ncbi:voltage-gated chloride channel family protein [Pedobacter immunditicola]|uniref:voltage-gated chloride channel family protein n=1 Tax=Pedobacter immunditicola TaxID=3133440 RepID=UPI0030B670A9
MTRNIPPKEFYTLIKQLLRWTIFVVPVSIVIGSVIAFFLWLLHAATQFRFNHYWLLYFLPLAGLLIHFIYHYFGQPAAKGNDLILEQIHVSEGKIPKRMAPIILFTTIITHLFGGSAGREGTAVQIGGSIASMYGRWFKLKGIDMRMILTAGVAAGFGAVFGTPVTGAIFAIEVITIGRIKYDALLPALLAAVVGDLTINAWQVSHTQYQVAALSHFDILLVGKVMVASVVFGLASYLFIKMISEVKGFCSSIFSHKWMAPVFGGVIIIGLTLLIGKPDYLGLGVDAPYPGAVTINSAFEGGADTWSWLWKTVYTAITLGTGFKGGEVTPLFYIGATLGNTLAAILNAPLSLFAALGFIAVFAGATNTPLACTMMGVELFGAEHVLLFAIACFTAYLFSGHSGIYGSQRITVSRSRYIHRKLRKYKLPFKKRY